MSAQKQKGTKFETSLLRLLLEYYPEASRLGEQGAVDRGDFKLPGEARFVIQAKNWNRMSLGAWVDAAYRQALNFDPTGNAVGVVAHKRKGVTDPAEQFITLKFGDFLKLVNSGPVCNE